MKRLTLILGLLLLTGIAHAQNGMSSTSSGSWNAVQISNFASAGCKAGSAYSCWHPMQAELNSFSSNYGVKGGLNSTGQIVLYSDYNAPHNPNTFTVQTAWGSGFTSLSIGGPTNIWAVGPSLTCGHGTTNIHIYNGNTWGENMGCKHVVHVAADRDGDGGGVESGGAWLYTKSSNTWQLADTTQKWIWMYIANATTVYLIKNDHTLWLWWVGTGYNQIPNMTTAAQVSVTKDGHIYVLDTSGNVQHYNETTSTWDQMYGTGFTSIAASGMSNIWAIGPTNSGYNTYRFNENGLHWTRSFNGTVTCGQNVPPSLCATFHHTACGQLQTQGHNGNQVCMTPFNGSGNFGWMADVDMNDIFSCFENISNCVIPEVVGNMNCSGGGSAFDNPANLIPSWSQDLASSNGIVNSLTATRQLDGTYIATAICGATHTDVLFGPTCFPGSSAVCQIVTAEANSDPQKTIIAAKLEATTLCQASSPWQANSVYFGNGPCIRWEWEDNAEIPNVCF